MEKRRGFTLLELMITLSVAAILVTVAVPGMRQFIQNSRATAQANELVTAINLARSEAGKRGAAVEVCASSDQATCNSSDWTDGWVVREQAGGTVIRVWQGLPDSANVNDNGDQIVFSALGEADNARQLTLWFDGCSGERQRQINVNVAGRPSVVRQACP